ncbi:MAG: ferredoxin [Gammaproteobacteria bacterium]
MAITVEIDRERCMGTGNCVFHAPGVFDQDDEGRSILADPGAQPESRIRFAASSCPVGAIRVVETGSSGDRGNDAP